MKVEFTKDWCMNMAKLEGATTMWAVHVQGPDDLHACPDRSTADALALVLNGQFQRQAKPGDPLMVATVTEWPHGYESWKAQSEQLRFEARKPDFPGCCSYGGGLTQCDMHEDESY